MNNLIDCPAHDNNLSANYKFNAPVPAGENLLAGTLHADGADGAEKPCVIDYSREEGAVDKALLERSKIVIVGTGGAYEVTCMFARCRNDEISPIY